jgi:hypothetical protein
LITPSILYACRDVWLPVAAIVYNRKLGCASGTLVRDGQVCDDCLGGPSCPALTRGCYRLGRDDCACHVGSWLHRTAWRTMITAYIFISAAQRDLLEPVELPTDRSFVKHNFVPAPPPHIEKKQKREVPEIPVEHAGDTGNSHLADPHKEDEERPILSSEART